MATLEQKINALKQIGQEWKKNELHRIYFNDLATWYGLDCAYYNTGNISGATLNGSRISNSEARKHMTRLADAKIWYDLADNKFHGKGFFYNDFEIISTAIKSKMAEMVEA